MPDSNLVIGIRADASQLRADLAVAQAQVTQFGQQLRAAAKESLVSGDTSTVAMLAGQFEGAVTHAKNLKAEIALGSAEALTFSQRLKEGAQGLESMAGQFRGGLGGLGLGGLLGGFSGTALGIAAVAAALGEVVHLATSAAAHAHEITAFAAAIGVSTGEVRAWTHAAAEAGVNEELFTKTLERQVISAEKASEALRKNAIEAAKIMAPEVAGGALRGGMNQTVPPPTSKMIDVGASFMKDTEQNRVAALSIYSQLEKAQEKLKNDGATPPPLQGWEAFFAALRQDAMKTTAEGLKLRDAITKAGGVVPAKSLSEELTRMEPGFLDPFTKIGVHVNDLNGKLREGGKLLADLSGPDGALARAGAAEALAFQVATGGRGARDPNMIDFMKSRAAADAFKTAPSQDAAIKAGDDAWKAEIKTIEQLKETGFQAGLAIDKAAMSMADHIGETTIDTHDLGKAFEGVNQSRFDAVSQGLTNLGDLATSIASKIADVLASASHMPPVGTAPGDIGGSIAGPFASGGLIRGPGTGTSDSILARVSTGEFIVPAAAAGPNLELLHALSSGFRAPRFALGGLVPGFAAGGLVTAGGGGGSVTVNLMLGGENFAMLAPQHVADKLVIAARQSQMLSAGKKPGWNGG